MNPNKLNPNIPKLDLSSLPEWVENLPEIVKEIDRALVTPESYLDQHLHLRPILQKARSVFYENEDAEFVYGKYIFNKENIQSIIDTMLNKLLD